MVGRLLWAERLAGRACLVFVDNEAAKSCLTAAYSRNQLACEIASAVADEDVKHQVQCWYERVPSLSNPADGPSRGEQAGALDGWRLPIAEPLAHDVLQTLHSPWG